MGLVKRTEVRERERERQRTLACQIDLAGIESGVTLGGGKGQDERGKQESEEQHIDLVALFSVLLG